MDVRQPERAHGQDGDYRAVRDLEGAAHRGAGVPLDGAIHLLNRWSRSIVCEFGDHEWRRWLQVAGINGVSALGTHSVPWR